jgi:hypothetical protein
MNKISHELGNIIEKASTRQVGATKTDKNGKTLVWTQLKSGNFDWRIAPSGTPKSDGGNAPVGKHAKMLAFLKKSPSDKLVVYANKPTNDPNLRQAAYDELVERGDDVSDIDLDTGRYGKLKSALSTDDDPVFELDDADDLDFDMDDEEDIDVFDPELIRKKFGNLKTKKQRIEYDNFVQKNKEKNPRYKGPMKEIRELNELYIQFLKTTDPLMIASGGAGVGKTFNFHLCAQACNKKPFNPEKDEPGDADYDYIEAPEVTPAQLIPLLKEHNGKIIFLDDSDGILKKEEGLGILKKATASSGKRIIGRKTSSAATSIDPFEFTGKIIFLTNMSLAELTKDDDMKAISSRAIKKDIYFTKKEQMMFIEKLKHKFEFTGVDRLPNKLDDIKEREEIVQILKDNYKDIDPSKFNSRILKEAMQKRRAKLGSQEMIANDPVMSKLLFHYEDDDTNADDEWKEDLVDYLTKGFTTKDKTLQKAKKILNLN